MKILSLQLSREPNFRTAVKSQLGRPARTLYGRPKIGKEHRHRLGFLLE